VENPKRGEMELNLGGKTYKARVTLDAIMKIETSCGLGIVKVLSRLTEGELTTLQVCSTILPVIRGGGNDFSMKDVQEIVWEAGLANSMRAVGEILAIALTGGQDEGNEKKAVNG